MWQLHTSRSRLSFRMLISFNCNICHRFTRMHLACTRVLLNGYDLLLCFNSVTGTFALTTVTTKSICVMLLTGQQSDRNLACKKMLASEILHSTRLNRAVEDFWHPSPLKIFAPRL